MDKLVIFEKVQSFVADFLDVDLSEVTLNTKIIEDVKTEHKPIMGKPSFGNLWGNFTLASSSSFSDSLMENILKEGLFKELEEEFNITIPHEEVFNIITVQEAVDCIFQKLTI
jgi:acyl carrier protein